MSLQDVHDAVHELKSGVQYVEKGTMTESVMTFAIERLERFLQRAEGGCV
jgi:hypothetical protein